MRRASHKLQVSTFPFLAVLLCAMGALIFFLLVMDRRAKLVAQHTLEEARAAQVADRTSEDAARKAEWEKQRNAIRQAILVQQEGLEKDAEAVRQQQLTAGMKLQAAKDEHSKLQSAVAQENFKLAQHQAQLKTNESGFQAAVKNDAALRAELIRLGAEVADLEKVLADLRALKKRETQTYSLVPYRGKLGDNRRPLYVECTSGALIFHPDRTQLAGLDFNAVKLRVEVERRAGGLERDQPTKGNELQEPKPARGPYVLFLIRPDGITSYYQALAFLKGFQIDFGYEVVDQHWTLEIPNGDQVASTPAWAQPIVPAHPIKSPTEKTPEIPAIPAVSLPGGVASSSGISSPGSGGGPPNSLTGQGSSSPPSLSGISNAVPPGVGGGILGNPAAGPGGMGQNPAALPAGNNMLPSVDTGVPRLVPLTTMPSTKATRPVSLVKAGPGLPFGGVAPGQGPAAAPTGVAPRQGSAGASTGASPGIMAPGVPASGSQGNSSEGSQAQGARPSVLSPPGPGTAKSKAPPTTGGPVLGNRDFVITIACFNDHVTVYPGGKQHWWKRDNTAATDQAVVRNVHDLIAGRQKSVQPGEPPYRPMIRFRLAADGYGSYLHVYPQLTFLQVPMTRENLDD